MGRRMDPAWYRGTVGLTSARERGDTGREFESRLRVTRSTIDRLGLEKELRGHAGCVNCLEWNKDGSVLASASDDLHVILWDPYRYKQLTNFATGHTGNIFSVKFISPHVLATCAADSHVRASDIESGTTLLECSCHCGRVKRLATVPDNHNLMWSAGEDGFIIQHDLRTAHRCNGVFANVAVNLLSHLGRFAEAKCVAVNPRRPHMLAVGANDFYVRIYDTRMIKLVKLLNPGAPGSPGTEARPPSERQNLRCNRAGYGDLDNNIPRAAAQYYAPGHLTVEASEHLFSKKTVTYLNFSPDGNELLVNLGSEQIYLFDVNSSRRPVLVESFIIQANHGCKEGEKQPLNGTCPEPSTDTKEPSTSKDPNGSNGKVADQYVLPEKVKLIKEFANEMVGQGKYTTAVEYYNEAIGRCPDCAILYSNRAAALMRRGWSGDTYAAIRDCYAAIRLDGSHVKSHFRLAKGLMDFKRAREAHECLLYFKNKFPRHAASHAVFLLQKDISAALKGAETFPDEGQACSLIQEGILLVGSSLLHHRTYVSSNSGDGEENPPISVFEKQLRASALDYKQRFLGHCNTTTDIKEANFLGPSGEYIAAGSDDGSIFIWCRKSGNIVRCLAGDESIVNCVQMHPSLFLMATSGIETVVRLWSPQPEEGSDTRRVIRDTGSAAAANQQRMRSDPFEAMLLDISQAGAGVGFAHDRLPHNSCRPT